MMTWLFEDGKLTLALEDWLLNSPEAKAMSEEDREKAGQVINTFLYSAQARERGLVWVGK